MKKIRFSAIILFLNCFTTLYSQTTEIKNLNPEIIIIQGCSNDTLEVGKQYKVKIKHKEQSQVQCNISGAGATKSGTSEGIFTLTTNKESVMYISCSLRGKSIASRRYYVKKK